MPKIIEKLKDKTCAVNDCSNNWKTKRKKTIDEKNICVSDCKEDNEYFYEYNNKCFNDCPKGAQLLYYIDYLCIIDCPENYPYEKNDECLDYCSSIEFFNKICRIGNYTTKAKEHMIENIKNEIINGTMNSLLSDILNEVNSDLIIKDKN